MKGRFTKCLALYWRSVIAVLVPIVLVPVFLLNDSTATRWLYVMLIMIIFWVTEALPQPVTSLIPIGLFPLLGVMDTVEICKLYAHETVFLFLGSLIIAASVEKCDLHKRVALKVLCHVKCGHRRLLFVLMAVTMFISMWMQNFTVVAMMSPVCVTILEQLEARGATTLFKSKTSEDSDEVLRPTRITMSYLLGITYAATLGGCGSLLGTPTNLAFKGIFETYFPQHQKIDFLRFLLYSAPVMLLNTLLTWLWLQFLFMGLLRPKSDDAFAVTVTEEAAEAVKQNIILNYKAMGRLTVAEIQVAFLLVFFQFLLVFRSDTIISKSRITDTSLTIILAIFLFMVPSKWHCFDSSRNTSDDNPPDGSQPLLTWTFVRRKVPWGLVILLGAGIAVADSGKKILKDLVIGTDMLNGIRPLGLLFIVCLLCQICTEFVSNVTTANIILPLLAELCTKGSFNTSILYFMFPAALSISMAFHSSIGTPGNAYVAGLINIPKADMFYCGIGPSIITLLTYWSTFPTYGTYVYKNATAT